MEIKFYNYKLTKEIPQWGRVMDNTALGNNDFLVLFVRNLAAGW